MPPPDVIVIGGGLHGCSAALHLARGGARVTLLEQHEVARHASGANAGGVRTLGRHPAEIPLALAARALWQNIGDLVDDPCGFQPSGQIMIAETAAELAQLQAREALVRGLGHTHEELIGGAELFALLPALARHCRGGLIARGDGFADPWRTAQAFRRKAASLGVIIREQCRAIGFHRRGAAWQVATGEGTVTAGVLVNCAGAWAGAVAAALGEPVPLQPIAPMMMVTARLPRFLDPVVIGSGRKLSFKQQPNGSVLIGGGHLARPDLPRGTAELAFAGLAESAGTVCDLFPIMRAAPVVRCWAGIEARMPDDIPVIGASSTGPAAFHAFGFSGHGFQLGPVVGGILADLITEGRSTLPITAFDIARFTAATPPA
jgi:sarcosine oxidase subunit beta